MWPAARPDRSLAWGLAGILLLTAWRVALLPFNRADLFVDDAQYWFWGQTLAWGYYSKPPLIAWILRLSTEIGGDGAFWIRLPLPLLHAATAVVVMLIASRLFAAPAAALAGVAWASLPGVAVGSLLVSTDTPMLLCYALAMLAHLHLAERHSTAWALAMGAAVGVGLLAKYAMLYFAICAGLAALILPSARIATRDTGLAAALALALVAPNLWWNATHQFATLQHTSDNAGWGGPPLRPLALLEFWAGQFAVAGPVLFAGYLWALRRLRPAAPPGLAWAAALSLPVFAIVSAQALRAGANANWAAAGHVGALVAALAVLRARPRLLGVGLALNLAVSLALPLATLRADTLRLPSGDLLFARYVGRADVSRRAAEIARAEGLDTLVSGSREMLADFFHTLRDGDIAIHAEPVAGFPPHHYAQTRPLPPGPGAVLYLTRDAGGPACAAGARPERIASWRPDEGYTTREIFAFRVARACWHPGRD
jgi:lipid A galacturonosyltransferase RgtD